MYIRKSIRTYKGKTYTNYLLVESVQTPDGPRQRTICSLGSLEPAPAEDWLALAHKLEAALHGQESLPDSPPEIEQRSEQARNGKKRAVPSVSAITVDPDRITMEEAREAGPVHAGHQMWRQLGIEAILQGAGLSERARRLTEAMTLNRLIYPLSEHAMPDWVRRTALGDILSEDFSKLDDDALYRNLDRLHPNREYIERELAEREKTLFNLDDTVYLYDLTSTYFEGQAKANPQAKRGYSRDKRPDCKQVVVGLVLDRDGFPKAHEVFDGNVQDRSSVDRMLDALEKRMGKKPGATVIVDRGMAYDENLEQIQKRGLHYLVAGLQPERNHWLDELENDDGWEEVLRTPSPRNPFQKKTRVEIKRQQKGDVVYILCRSEGRQDLTADEIWRTYILLTRVEDAFRDMKSPLMERPIFHHLKHRTQTHIFLCVLAYHLLAAIEHRFLQAGIHTSWWTIRQQLSTHQVVTIVLPTTDGRVLKIRKATTAEPLHREIYSTLRIPEQVMTPIKTWHLETASDEKKPKL